MKVERPVFRCEEVALSETLVGTAADRRASAALREALAVAWTASGAFEWVALGYLALSSCLIALFAENLRHPFRLIALQGFVGGAILALAFVEARSAERARSRGVLWTTRFWHFWRHWYPHLFFVFCFEELGQLVHLFDSRWQDPLLIAFDHWLTGVHPAIWLEQFSTPARNDFFQFAYLTYFA